MDPDNVTVAISSDFLDSFAKLPRKVQSKTSAFVNKFKNDPTSGGIHYEKINSAEGALYSVRIDDTYRGIIMRQKAEGVYLLLWVDHHDEAYEWAKRRRVAVNPATGTLQVYETVSAIAEESRPQCTGLFDCVSDDDLIELGIPEELKDFVRSLGGALEFFNAAGVLPVDAFENLSWIANGIPVVEVLDMVRSEASEQVTSAGIASALARPDSLRSFVVVEGEDELFQILSAPLEKWRVFLHPSQRKLVKRSYNGPARVLGSAGTGKTVVAMHRAKYLAGADGRQMLPSYSRDNDSILFTTFSSTLSADIASNLQKICSKEELRKIDIVNLDSWVSRFLRERELDFQIEYEDSVLEDIWKEAISDSGTTLDFDPSFYADEWSDVVLAQDIEDLASYARTKRTGRGTRLNRGQRIAVWSVMEKYRQMLKARRLRDVDFAMNECAKLVSRMSPEGVYEHVVVDEGQDFSAPAFRLIRALAGPEHKDDIFIVGDSRQRIYRRKAVLSACGIRIVGRSSILRINYRTTEEIRCRAVAVLEGIGFDDLDGGVDEDARAQSLLHGTEPNIKGFKSEDEEVDEVVSKVKELLDSEVDLRDVCVVARTKKRLSSFAYAVQKMGIPVCELQSRKADDRKVEGLRFASMHRVKGLEFDHVFIVDASEEAIPPGRVVRRKEREGSLGEFLQGEKSLLYVAMTRAKKSVSISYVGKKSQLL